MRRWCSKTSHLNFLGGSCHAASWWEVCTEGLVPTELQLWQLKLQPLCSREWEGPGYALLLSTLSSHLSLLWPKAGKIKQGQCPVGDSGGTDGIGWKVKDLCQQVTLHHWEHILAFPKSFIPTFLTLSIKPKKHVRGSEEFPRLLQEPKRQGRCRSY